MNLASAIDKGINGASTLSLLQDAITKIDTSLPLAGLLSKPGTLKKIKKQSKKGKYPADLYIRLAADLVSGAGYYGLSALGKKKNAVWIGGLLGAAAGIGHAVFSYDDAKPDATREDYLKAALTVVLYISGGVLAGAAVKRLSKKAKKRKKK